MKNKKRKTDILLTAIFFWYSQSILAEDHTVVMSDQSANEHSHVWFRGGNSQFDVFNTTAVLNGIVYGVDAIHSNEEYDLAWIHITRPKNKQEIMTECVVPPMTIVVRTNATSSDPNPPSPTVDVRFNFGSVITDLTTEVLRGSPSTTDPDPTLPADPPPIVPSPFPIVFGIIHTPEDAVVFLFAHPRMADPRCVGSSFELRVPQSQFM